MTCTFPSEQVDAWLAGTLTEAEAAAVERHAAACPLCAARLDAGTRFDPLARELSPPAALRASILDLVAKRRARRNRWRWAAGAGAIAATVAILLSIRPHSRSATTVPGDTHAVNATTRAQPDFAALDAAEHDVLDALRSHPEDAGLVDALNRIRRQRDELHRIVLAAQS
ncbi:MAG: zf-HC2 domain-containing protein [Gemmatimonadales bacterium]